MQRNTGEQSAHTHSIVEKIFYGILLFEWSLVVLDASVKKDKTGITYWLLFSYIKPISHMCTYDNLI